MLDAGANGLVKVPFDRLRANVRAEAKAPFMLSLSKRIFGIVSKPHRVKFQGTSNSAVMSRNQSITSGWYGMPSARRTPSSSASIRPA